MKTLLLGFPVCIAGVTLFIYAIDWLIAHPLSLITLLIGILIGACPFFLPQSRSKKWTCAKHTKENSL